MSDIRLIMTGCMIIFSGFIVAGLAGSQYSQMAVQKAQFDDCYDYSTGKQVYVNCTYEENHALMLLALALGLMGGGSYVVFRGIRGSWDQNVKSGEMVGPKRG